METNRLSELVKSWLYEAGDRIKQALSQPLEMTEKTDRTDIVTNVDREIEQFFVNKIVEYFPNDRVLGEEGTNRYLEQETERTWIIDPIDGTLNFYKQQDYFCLMLAIEQESGESLGFIYELMRDELLWGGEASGVYLNDVLVKPPANQTLVEGIVSLNSGMLLENTFALQTVAKQAIGVRMVGCAGIGIKEVLLGKQAAYISYLQPWDFAAGRIMAKSLGIVVAEMNGQELTMTQRQAVIFATPATYEEIKKMQEL
ncbi:inositol monophosphatase family protein [Vagococcus zengguangii]